MLKSVVVEEEEEKARTSVLPIFQPVTIGDDVADEDAIVLVEIDEDGMNLFNEFEGDIVGLSSTIVGRVDRRYSNCS